MKIRYLLSLACLIAMGAQAAPEDMVTYVWDVDCNHTMTTNHFMLPPSMSTTEIKINFVGCTEEQMGSLVFFGYHTTKTRSRQLSSKDKISLYMTALDRYGNKVQNMSSSSGALLGEITDNESIGCLLVAKNNGRKEKKIRLRAQLIAE